MMHRSPSDSPSSTTGLVLSKIKHSAGWRRRLEYAFCSPANNVISYTPEDNSYCVKTIFSLSFLREDVFLLLVFIP